LPIKKEIKMYPITILLLLITTILDIVVLPMENEEMKLLLRIISFFLSLVVVILSSILGKLWLIIAYSFLLGLKFVVIVMTARN
jgi:hypothetical protein